MNKMLLPLMLISLASCDKGNKTTNTTISNGVQPGYAGMYSINGNLGLNTTNDAELVVTAWNEFEGEYTAIATGSSHPEQGQISYNGFGTFRIERDDYTIDYWNTTLAVGNSVLLDAGDLGTFLIQL